MEKSASPHKLRRATRARERSDRITRARELRNNATPAEQLLWEELRNRKLKGRKFRRQCPLGSYFADFVCFSERLIIELDGAHHAEPAQANHDRRRSVWLNGQHFRVLRFLNEDVRSDLPMVLATIAHAVENPQEAAPTP